MIRHKPKRDPKFHMIVMFVGEGRSISDPLIILNKGCVLRTGVDISVKIVVGHQIVCV